MRALLLAPVLETDDVQGVTVCRFAGSNLVLDDRSIAAAQQQIEDLIERSGCKQIVLDFRDVRFIAGATRAFLIALNRRVHALGGSLVICRMNARVREIFELTQLTRVLDIRTAATLELALAS